MKDDTTFARLQTSCQKNVNQYLKLLLEQGFHVYLSELAFISKFWLRCIGVGATSKRQKPLHVRQISYCNVQISRLYSWKDIMDDRSSICNSIILKNGVID